MNVNENIIAKYLSGNCSPEEKLWVEEQLTSSASFKADYDAFTMIWGLSEHLIHDASVAEAAWKDFEANVKAPKKTLGFDWLKLAASIALLAAFSVALFSYLNKGNSYTSEDDLLNVDLVDHSSIILSEHSVLLSSKEYNKKNRELSLEGEAFFDVAKSGSPFIVKLGDHKIRVTGTKFNAVKLPGSDFISIELFEGSLDFIADNNTYSLKAGQRLEYENGLLNLVDINHAQPAWFAQNEINCVNSSLQYILTQIQKHYDLEYHMSKRALKERYTVALPKDDLDACIKALTVITRKQILIEDGKITSR